MQVHAADPTWACGYSQERPFEKTHTLLNDTEEKTWLYQLPRRHSAKRKPTPQFRTRTSWKTRNTPPYSHSSLHTTRDPRDASCVMKGVCSAASFRCAPMFAKSAYASTFIHQLFPVGVGTVEDWDSNGVPCVQDATCFSCHAASVSRPDSLQPLDHDQRRKTSKPQK